MAAAGQVPTGTVVPEASIATAAGHYSAGAFDAAAGCCLDILAQEPGHFDALHMLGVLCCNRRDFADAVSLLTRAQQVRQDVARLYANLGNAWMGLRLPDRAEAAYRRALALGPVAPEPLSDLGTALGEAGRHAEAEACYRQALALRPDFAPARYNLGRALVALDRPEEAIAAFQAVLDSVADPLRREEVAGALATALGSLARYAEAAALCRALLAEQPGSAAMAWNESLALLSLGRYAEGWRQYEARWRVATHDPLPPGAAVLDLAAVTGRHIAVLAEQGRGDILQFARYAPLLAARGAQVTLQAYADLVPVLETLPGVRVITLEHAVPPADLTTPLLSLPLAFATTVETIPAVAPYLHAPPDRLAAWRERLGPRVGTAPRVGIAWRGLQHIPYRSVPLPTLAPLLAAGGCTFHALQKDILPEDRTWLAAHGVADHSAALADFADTAALIALMDLVVTIDTAVAHLAGALGAPTWVMLAFNADWRWLTEREDCPWYPTARLFRQHRPGDWDGVVARVAAAMAGFAAAARSLGGQEASAPSP